MTTCEYCGTDETADPSPKTTLADELFCSAGCRDQYFETQAATA